MEEGGGANDTSYVRMEAGGGENNTSTAGMEKVGGVEVDTSPENTTTTSTYAGGNSPARENKRITNHIPNTTI